MRRRPTIAVGLLAAATLVLSLISNLAASAVPKQWLRSPIWIWVSLLILAGVFIADEISKARRDRTPVTANDPARDASLTRAAAALAAAVHNQWLEEATIRSLDQPEPIHVQWSTTGRPVTATLAAIDPRYSDSEANFHRSGDLINVLNALNKLPHRQLVVLGQPGAGKSVLVLLLTLQLLKDRTVTDPVPVLLSLSSWNPRHEHLTAWIARRIGEDYRGLTNTNAYGPNVPMRLLSNKLVLPILDGLDELPEDLQPMAVESIDRALSNQMPAIVTCRTEEYESAVRTSGRVLARAAVIEIEPLSVATVADYLIKVGPASDRRWLPVLDRLRDHTAGMLANAFATPLIVWLARVAYTSPYTDPAELLDTERFPDRSAIESHLLDGFLDAVYSTAPQAPGSPPRRIYQVKAVRKWLSYLATRIQEGGGALKDRADSPNTTDLAWWKIYFFLSRTERTAAGVLAGVAIAVIPSFTAMELFIGFTPHRVLALGVSMLSVLVGVGLVGFFLNPPPPGRVQVTRPRRSDLERIGKLGLTYGLIGMLIIGLAGGSLATFVLGFNRGLRIGIVIGFLAWLSVVIEAWLNVPVDTVEAATPPAILAADRVAALATGLTSFFAFGVAILYIFGWRPPVIVVGAAVAAITNAIGFTSWGWYIVVRFYLALRGLMPWTLSTFLRDAHGRGVLRQAGGVYQFRHLLLQERLSAKSNTGRAVSDQP